MKRDMELIRKILFEIEGNYQPGQIVINSVSIEGYDLNTIAEHCELLFDAGLIRFTEPIRSSGAVLNISVGNLTNDGYDYLELIRNENVWQQTNEEVKKKKLPQTIETIGTVAASIVGAFMREYNR